MTFLSPWTGIIGGLIAVPIVIALYMLKLRRKTLRISTTLLWEQAAADVQANVPLKWLRPSWLLAMQLLGLALLLAALARPAVKGEQGVAPRTVIVIDHSASMNAPAMTERPAPGAAPGPTRLDRAKERALELIDQVQRSPGTGGQRARGMIVALAGEARALTPLTDDVRTLREAVRSIGPTDQPARTEGLVRLLRGVGAQSPEASEAGSSESDRLQAIVLTDTVLDEPTGGQERSEALPGGVDVSVVRVGPEAGVLIDNVGIAALSARRDATDPRVLRVFVRLVNASAANVRAPLTVRLVGEGSPSQSVQTVDVPAARVDEQGVVVAGEASVTVTFEQSAGALLTARIERSDALSADDEAALVIPEARRPRVMVVGPGVEGDPFAAARGRAGVDALLLGVLTDLEPEELRVVSRAEYLAWRRSIRSSTGAPVWRPDIVWFDRATPESAEELPPVPSVHIGAVAAGVVPGVSVSAEDAGATRLASWRRTHPLLKSVPVDALFIAPAMTMSVDEEAARAQGSRVTTLATGNAGPLMAVVSKGAGGVSRVVIGFDLVHSNWGSDVSFPVFVAGAVDVLTGRGESALGVGSTTAEAVQLRVQPGSRGVELKGPVSVKAEPPAGAEVASEDRVVSLGLMERVGVYSVDGAADVRVLCVNLLDAHVSTLTGGREVRLAGREISAGAGSPVLGRAAPVKEIWPIFVIASAVLLTIEWFVYARKMRV